MSSLMDEISRDVEEAPRLRVRVAQLEREVRSLRARNGRLNAALYESDMTAVDFANRAREADKLLSRVVGQLLAIDLHEAGAMMRCFEFVRGVREGASCQYMDFAPWTELYRRTLMCWSDVGRICWIVRERIPMWTLDGRRARADEVMAAFKTRAAAIDWIERENEE